MPRSRANKHDSTTALKDPRSLVGVVGGIGPEAGLDVVRRIYRMDAGVEETNRIGVLLHSVPALIADRNEFLLGRSSVNPADGILEAIEGLANCGAKVVGIACNAAHSNPIFSVLEQGVCTRIGGDLRLISMVDSVVDYLLVRSPSQTVAVLSVLGTYEEGVYERSLKAAGVRTVRIDRETAEMADALVWNRTYGVKYFPTLIPQTLEQYRTVLDQVEAAGAQVVVLACTELSLISEASGNLNRTLSIVDANQVFAAALYEAANPDSLVP